MPSLITWWTQDLFSLSPAAASDQVAAAGAELLRRWTEPHRRYHSTRHLVEMFWALEDLTGAGELTEDEARLGRIAAWLHDAEYDPAAPPGDNEAESARLAASMLPRAGLATADTVVVVELVEMTAAHEVTHDSTLQRSFHDADLWILAAGQERFDGYCAQVREEYAAVPEVAYRVGRSAILQQLVGPEPVYLTHFGRDHWEGPARDNVARELARLS